MAALFRHFPLWKRLFTDGACSLRLVVKLTEEHGAQKISAERSVSQGFPGTIVLAHKEDMSVDKPNTHKHWVWVGPPSSAWLLHFTLSK